MDTPQEKTFDPQAIRADFPILNQRIHRDRPLVYLDNGASTQHPQVVIDAMSDCYSRTYANVHRGIHWLSEQASAQYENARTLVQTFINAEYNNEVIFTSGTTASINLVARAWGDTNLKPGDEILLTIFEHHSNIVPWQQLAERTGATVRFATITSEGELDLDDFRLQLNDRTKIVAFASVSNVLGTITPVAELVQLAKSVGAITVVDAAQSVPHGDTDVQAWDADFVAFSAHKMLGPSGVGILWGRQALLESMPPFLGGGSMIDQVTTGGFTWGELPARFEAGTPPIVEAIGLGAAIEYLNAIDVSAIARYEHELVAAAIEAISGVDGLRILGPPADRRAGLVSFVVDGVSTQDLSILLDQQGVAIRAGHHCAMPLHQQLDIRSSCRASFYLYNTLDEVELFAEALNKVLARLR
ncbi:MAG: cysteine desulfurase/selenocysteine lyase [Mariniblastus sp.]|jgi:cysteine desulfurase/selenocysteine lyase